MKPRKYRNQPVVVDNLRFDSKAEAKRYGELTLLQKAGEISRLEVQPKYTIKIAGKLVCTYKGDFRYLDTRTSQWTLEDVKSPATAKNPTYRLKKKLVEALYAPLKIVEVMK